MEQVNPGGTEMDTVARQNAATAADAASAAEELNAQAEQVKEVVARLTALVKGG